MDITVLNLMLAAVVTLMGLLAYARRRSSVALLVAVAFGLFAVAHLLTLLGLSASLSTLLILIRVLGYAAAALAMYRLATQV